MTPLEFKTRNLFSNDLQSVNIEWSLLNEEISDQCSHAMDFTKNGRTISEIIAGYEGIAKNEIFKVIDSKFPGLYEL